MVATEIAILPLKAAFDPNDKTSETGLAQSEGYKVISKAPGFIESWYGGAVEDDKELQMFLNWESVQSHLDFTTSPTYADLGKHLGAILAGAPTYVHYHFTSQSELKTVLSAPVTENVTLYFPAVDESFGAKIEVFRQAVEAEAVGAKGLAYGWGEEDVEHEKLEGKGKALKLLIGWESVDAHMKFRETEAFQKNVGLFREVPKAVEMKHVKLRPQSEAI
ncbi:hypothetical protein CAC42_478 [Sphaceloma murrayae]|uniref:ABM domain-containing protein n=1 Tax=Sphaceloma murrayae TaxID=2082308 RepID=A0A2K1R3M0_9PEZI|nr:hypothetical protein CAC42_478 [Sphaceloma murrayae]